MLKNKLLIGIVSILICVSLVNANTIIPIATGNDDGYFSDYSSTSWSAIYSDTSATNAVYIDGLNSQMGVRYLTNPRWYINNVALTFNATNFTVPVGKTIGDVSLNYRTGAAVDSGATITAVQGTFDAPISSGDYKSYTGTGFGTQSPTTVNTWYEFTFNSSSYTYIENNIGGIIDIMVIDYDYTYLNVDPNDNGGLANNKRVYINQYESGNVPYLNITFVDEDSCTYSGSGDWEITISDNCDLSTPTDLGANKLIVSGDAGKLTISSKIEAKEIHYKPDNFNGDFIIETVAGGQLVAKP